jgi:hypothetical protein
MARQYANTTRHQRLTEDGCGNLQSDAMSRMRATEPIGRGGNQGRKNRR